MLIKKRVISKVICSKKTQTWFATKIIILDIQNLLVPSADYGQIFYDQLQNDFLCEKLESVQHKAAVAITGAMQGTSRDKIYQELGIELFKSRR